MTTKRDKYLKWKHELLDNCGQCIGFRARGINLADSQGIQACGSGVDCHTSCPALGMGGGSGKENGGSAENNGPGAATEKKDINKKIASTAAPGDETTRVSYIPQKCFRCGRSEDEGVLLPCRSEGQSLWVCTKCLPVLIHG